ncbi:P-selectin-like [Dysidea avara]|uniref:P-selectin-like n=1 Tax=Dysidea avara TaxID=196820 RepID=UPI00331E1721
MKVPVCPPLSAPENGGISCTLGDDGVANEGESCTFSCDDGYKLNGPAKRVCQKDQSWNSVQPVCTKVIKCPVLTAPDNGDIVCFLGGDGIPTPGRTCTFTCDDGFDLNGTAATRICQSDGRWHGTDVTCTKRVPTCPPLTAPDNGDIDCSLGDNGEANPGDTCTFTCDDGYELGGSTSRTCGDDGSWSGTDTTCTRIPTCPPLTAPDNGDIDCSLGDDGEANPGDTCTFTCDDGYELGGSTSRTCGDDGNWSGTDTTCTRVVTCPPLTAPDNGDIDCSLGDDGEANPGDTCTFTCDGGYELGGSSSRTCGDDGSWSGTDTTCTRIPTCPPLTAPDNGDIDCSLGDNGEANPGDTCTFTCDDGYELGGSTSRTCGDDGRWSGTDTTCTRVVTCPPLTAPDNGDIDCSLGGDGEANPGDTCTFTCDDGYELGGSTSRTCGDDGSWSGTDTTCTRIPTCPPLTTPDNGDVDCSLGDDGEANPGDTCTYSCDDGYDLSGSTTRACQDDGTWSGTEAVCSREITCPPLTAPDNGGIDCSLGDDGVPHEGDTCSFTCDDGYDLTGSDIRTCQNDGMWSGTEAMCNRVTVQPVCPLLTAPNDGIVDCSLGDDGVVSEGDSCTVMCNTGFELQGSTSRTCQADGTWSGTETKCEEVTQCPSLDAPNNGAIDCSVGEDGVPSIGDKCTFTCDDGYELQGKKTRNCRLRRRNGKWSGSDVKCNKVKSCPPLTAPDNGKIDCSLGNDGLPTPQDKCTASCNNGFVLSGTTTRRCKADETWTGSDAVCTAVDGVTCEPLTAPDNGMIDCSLGGDGVPNEGETCKFSCNDGFELEGSTSRKCRSSGNWNGKDATCIGGTCPLLSAPDNGQVSCSLGDDGEANNGDSCDFTCDGGLVLHGSASRSCTGGIWSGDESLCVPDGACPPLPAPDNGMIGCSLGDDGVATEGDSCSFSCDGTYVLRGSSSRACQNDGTWDGTEADCLSCNEVQSIATDLETTSDTATITFTAHADASFTCRLDREAKVDCTSPHTYTGLSKGKHKIVVVSKCPGERTGINAKVDFRIL